MSWTKSERKAKKHLECMGYNVARLEPTDEAYLLKSQTPENIWKNLADKCLKNLEIKDYIPLYASQGAVKKLDKCETKEKEKSFEKCKQNTDRALDQILHAGVPDFLVWKDDEKFFVEVKKGNTAFLSKSQLFWMERHPYFEIKLGVVIYGHFQLFKFEKNQGQDSLKDSEVENL